MPVWRDCIADNHLWAFYYFCKRLGDRVTLERDGQRIRRKVRKREVVDLRVERKGIDYGS